MKTLPKYIDQKKLKASTSREWAELPQFGPAQLCLLVVTLFREFDV